MSCQRLPYKRKKKKRSKEQEREWERGRNRKHPLRERLGECVCIDRTKETTLDSYDQGCSMEFWAQYISTLRPPMILKLLLQAFFMSPSTALDPVLVPFAPPSYAPAYN